MFLQWLDRQHRFNTRMELGMKSWDKVFTKAFLRELRDDLGMLIVLVLLSPLWILTYYLGRYTEWKDDKAKGITNVKP